MISLQGGKPERVVLVCVALAAYPEQPKIQQARSCRQNSVPSESLGSEVATLNAPERRKATTQRLSLDVFLDVTLVAPPLVIQVLATSGVVYADGLQMPVGVRADPDLSPCWWYREPPDALNAFAVDSVALGVEEGEPGSAPSSDDPGLAPVATPKARQSSPLWLERDRFQRLGGGSVQHSATGRESRTVAWAVP